MEAYLRPYTDMDVDPQPSPTPSIQRLTDVATWGTTAPPSPAGTIVPGDDDDDNDHIDAPVRDYAYYMTRCLEEEASPDDFMSRLDDLERYIAAHPEDSGGANLLPDLLRYHDQ